jgi:hypothetical protein
VLQSGDYGKGQAQVICDSILRWKYNKFHIFIMNHSLLKQTPTFLTALSRCIGTIQHLKSKFDSGYILTVQLKEGSDPMQAIALSEVFLGFMSNLSPTSRVLDQDNATHFVIAIPR